MSKKTNKVLDAAKNAGIPELEPFISVVEQKGKDVSVDDPDFVVLFEKAKELGILNFQLIQTIQPKRSEDEDDTEKDHNEQAQTTPVNKETGEYESLSYQGIKYMNGKYYHESDAYAIGFDQADECARHYNTK